MQRLHTGRVRPEQGLVIATITGLVASVAGVIAGIAVAAHGAPGATCDGNCMHPRLGLGLCFVAVSVALGALVYVGYEIASSIATMRTERILAERRRASEHDRQSRTT